MVTRTIAAVCLTSAAVALSSAAAAAAAPGASTRFCARVGHSIEASGGAQMYCFGSQPSVGSTFFGAAVRHAASAAFSANVNAASLTEDISPGGARGYGQSETSIAAVPPYVVEGWNDATSFFSACPSPMNKEEGTGLGFSANGGGSFTDLGGPPNAACAERLLQGDPSVEGWKSGGSTYFYVASLYPTVSFTSMVPVNSIALNTCKATGSGATAKLSCGQPLMAAGSTECIAASGGFPPNCSFLDKEFLSIDPVHGRLYITYTEFGFQPTTFNGQIDLAVCDIGLPSGAAGPAGGTAGHPVCEHGTLSNGQSTGSPYLAVAPGDPNCETEGSYPAADTTNGDVYVAYEFNPATNIFAPPCFSTPTREVVNRIAASCLTLSRVSPCSGATSSVSQTITSMDGAMVPGYNRFPGNDFPRIAVDRPAGTVSIVWNDAGAHPLGDILLRSYALGSLTAVQAAPVRLNSGTGGLHFLPALRNASATGKLAVSWFDRATPTTTLTDVRADLSLNPRLTSPPPASALVTSQSSDWNAVSSDIVPNFGDYTDDYAVAGRLYLAWSDGRLGVPQPFASSAALP